MKTSDFDYYLPPELIAQFPVPRREESRLLVVDRSAGTLEHRRFTDLPGLIAPGDAVVLNETKVFPARLRGRRAGGGEAEILLLHPAAEGGGVWAALVRPASKMKPGRVVEVGAELSVEVVGAEPDGSRWVRLRTSLPHDAALERYGEVPLPPYVHRPVTEEDRVRYQTVYARETGSVAAPTAGLHFTPELLRKVEGRGARIARLVLHVGVGTFRPVADEDPSLHPMHREWYRVPPEAAAVIATTRRDGGAVWAIGTTTVRTLETVAAEGGEIRATEGWTDIFIRPPYTFRAVDRLLTNFHLPRSTLLMLVAAFAGYDLIMRAYHEAIEAGYRFYSYGDAMAIL